MKIAQLKNSVLLWIILWCLTLTANFYLRQSYCQIAPWSWDQTALLWQSLMFNENNQFPITGITSSVGTYSFNATTLITALFARLCSSIDSISLSMTCFQMTTILILLFTLKNISQSQRWFLGLLLLFNPYVIAISLDNWPQYFTGNFICLCLTVFILIYRHKQSTWLWFFFGFLLSLTTVLYLGHISFLVSSAIFIIVLKYFKKIVFGIKQISFMFLGSTPIFALIIIPYFSQFDQLSDLSVLMHKGPDKTWSNFLLALTHPWRLLFSPHHHYWYSNSQVVDADTMKGVFSFFSILIFHLVFLFLFLCNLLILLLNRKNKSSFKKTFFNQDAFKIIFLYWLTVLFLNFILPSNVFYADHKGAAWYVPGYLLIYTGALSTMYFLFKRLKILTTILVISFTICCSILSIKIIKQHLSYSGQYIPYIDAPLKDRLSAVDYIAVHSKDKKHISIGYNFNFNNRINQEKEFETYVHDEHNYGLETGRLYDAQLLLKYSKTNTNPHRKDRSQGQHDYLITYSFVDSLNLNSPWSSSEQFVDFGQIRVFVSPQTNKSN